MTPSSVTPLQKSPVARPCRSHSATFVISDCREQKEKEFACSVRPGETEPAGPAWGLGMKSRAQRAKV